MPSPCHATCHHHHLTPPSHYCYPLPTHTSPHFPKTWKISPLSTLNEGTLFWRRRTASCMPCLRPTKAWYVILYLFDGLLEPTQFSGKQILNIMSEQTVVNGISSYHFDFHFSFSLFASQEMKEKPLPLPQPHLLGAFFHLSLPPTTTHTRFARLPLLWLTLTSSSSSSSHTHCTMLLYAFFCAPSTPSTFPFHCSQPATTLFPSTHYFYHLLPTLLPRALGGWVDIWAFWFLVCLFVQTFLFHLFGGQAW